MHRQGASTAAATEFEPGAEQRPTQLTKLDSQRPEKDALRGLLVFIAEDEILVALQLEDTLQRLGCHVLEPAQTFDDAAEILDSREFDVAILDINLAGKVVYPIARRLADRGVPFVFTTAYATSYVNEVWPDAPTLSKPYSEAQLVRAVAKAAGRRAAAREPRRGEEC